MTGRGRRSPTRVVVAAAGAAWGAALVWAAPAMLRMAGDPRPGKVETRAARILGARHLAQSLLQVTAGENAIRVGAGVDAMHCVSMAALAAASPRYRRPATVSAATAAAFSVIAWRSVRRAHPAAV